LLDRGVNASSLLQAFCWFLKFPQV
jgi:hypothetical protein